MIQAKLPSVTAYAIRVSIKMMVQIRVQCVHQGTIVLAQVTTKAEFPCPGFIGSPPISNSPQGSDELVDCVCEPGYYENNPETGTCADCPANFYCNDDVRHPCPTPNTQSQLNSDDYTDCKCTQGYWRDGCTPVEVGGLLVYQKK